MKNSVIICLVVSMTCVAFAQLPNDWTNFQPIQPYPFLPFPYSVSPLSPVLQTNEKPGTEATTTKQFGPHSSLILGSHVNCLKQLKEETDAIVEKIKAEFGNDISFLRMEMEGMKRLMAEMKHEMELIRFNIAETEIESFKTELNVTMSKMEKDIKDLFDEMKASTSASSIGKIPSSCNDLKTIGHVKSGVYSVKRNNRIESLYCDFTKNFGNSDFQKSIGYVNVKSTSVYFHAQREGNYQNGNTGIPFNKIGINVGKALDASTGVFVAPASGKYFFAYSGLSWDSNAKVQLQKKTNGSADWSKIGESHSTAWNAMAIQTTLQLAKGDRVRLFLIHGIIHDADGNNFSNYVGWLQEEDIA